MVELGRGEAGTARVVRFWRDLDGVVASWIWTEEGNGVSVVVGLTD